MKIVYLTSSFFPYGSAYSTRVLNIGRLLCSIAKNHKFLKEIFKDYHNRNQYSVLLLVGGGNTDKIKTLVKEKNLQGSIYFMGQRDDVAELHSASDCFIFPSLYEGLPGAVIEAQASGIPC